MRIAVDLTDAQMRALDALSRKEKRPRAALIRQAIHDFLGERRGEQAIYAFGLWAKRKKDGLAFQKKVRSEW
jgi:Predicted transcriptional regulators containing the CopG/Arc/MetJ DNA-binding domain and a metal-binding domain